VQRWFLIFHVRIYSYNKNNWSRKQQKKKRFRCSIPCSKFIAHITFQDNKNFSGLLGGDFGVLYMCGFLSFFGKAYEDEEIESHAIRMKWVREMITIQKTESFTLISCTLYKRIEEEKHRNSKNIWKLEWVENSIKPIFEGFVIFSLKMFINLLRHSSINRWKSSTKIHTHNILLRTTSCELREEKFVFLWVNESMNYSIEYKIK
jgi:hypothetical protein